MDSKSINEGSNPFRLANYLRQKIMMAPEERYNSDPEYRMLVDTIESLIHKAQFTPSEIRQAALLACIRYESINPRTPYFLEGEYEIDKIKAEIKIIKNHLKEIKIIKKHLNLHG